MSKFTMKNTSNQFSQLLEKTGQFIKTPNGQITAFIAAIAVAGGVMELSSSINVRNDKAGQEIKQQNSKNFYKYKMLQSPASLIAHGSCAPELNAESKYYSEAARIVGPDRGIAENGVPLDYKYLNDNAKIYRQSAKLALANEVSCYAANSKVSSLTPHFDIANMSTSKHCAANLEKLPVNDIYAEPTQFGRDMAAVKNVHREIAIDLAKTQNIAC